MKKFLYFLLILLLAVLSRIAEATPPQLNNLTSCQLSSNLNSLTSTCADVPPPNVSIPSLYDGTSNTKHHGSFGADYFRITLPSGITDKTVTQLVPDYSKTPAWNSDGSIIILKGTQNGHIHLLNGNTYEYIRELMNITDIWYYQYPEPRWSHTDPDVFYYVSGMKFNSYRISTHVTTTIHTFTDNDFGGTGLSYISCGDEGNPDDTDRYWAFIGMTADDLNTGQAILVYDKQTNTVLSHKDYGAGGMCGAGACPVKADAVGMSHSGNHVTVVWKQQGDNGDFTTRGTGYESFNRSLTYLVKLSEQNNHMDVAQLSNGTDVLVGRSHMTDNNSYLAMRAMNLDNGSIMTTCMLPVDTGLHISGRTTSSLLKGWVLLSIYDQDVGGLGSGVFASENIAMNMDTCEVRRIAHTQSYHSTYFTEPHAAVNWDFTKIIWGSNWRNASNPVQTYVAELTVRTKALSSPSTIIMTP
jgi:hypothetical protein